MFLLTKCFEARGLISWNQGIPHVLTHAFPYAPQKRGHNLVHIAIFTKPSRTPKESVSLQGFNKKL